MNPWTWLQQLVDAGWGIQIDHDGLWYTIRLIKGGEEYQYTNLDLAVALMRAWQGQPSDRGRSR